MICYVSFDLSENILHVLIKRKRLKHVKIQTHKQTTESNTYHSVPPQGTSDIARGVDLLRKGRTSKIA